jgi:hypothetical protein
MEKTIFLLREHRTRILVLSFLATLFLLIFQTVLNTKDINDTWILEGILPLFMFFTILYVAIATLSRSLELVTAITSIYVGTMNLIPQLKYTFLYGFFDPLYHYQFIRELAFLGRIPPAAGSYTTQYGPTPGSQVTVAAWSVLSGMSPLMAYKAFLAVTPVLIPLAVYVVLKKTQAPVGLSKIIVASTAITLPVLYVFTGRTAVLSLYLLFTLLSFVLLSVKKVTRSGFIMTLSIGVAVVLSHDVTSFFLVVTMIILLIMQRLMRSRSISANSRRSFTYLILAFVTIASAHFVFMSSYNMTTIIDMVRSSVSSLFARRTPGAIGYYSGFYRLDLLGQIVVFVVRIGRYALSILLLAVSPVAIYRIVRKNDALKRYYQTLAIPTVVALLVFVMTQFTRSNLVDRGLIYIAALSPFFAGITIYWVVRSSRRFSNIITALVLFGLLSASLIQFYPCQPLIPKIYDNGVGYYAMDLRSANTIYQRSMVKFVSLYDTNSTMATDPITTGLIYALTEPSTQVLLTGENPLETGIRAQLILASLDANAHPIVSGAQAVEYFRGVANLTNTRSMIYANGKSCILLNLGGH